MTELTEAAVLDALRAVREPELPGDIVSRDMVRGLMIEGTRVAFTIEPSAAPDPASVQYTLVESTATCPGQTCPEAMVTTAPPALGMRNT